MTYVKKETDIRLKKGKKKMKQNDLITIIIKSKMKKTTDGKKKFRTFRTPMKLIVVGEEEKGKQIKDVTVKFVSDVDTKNITNGKLTCYVKDLNFPRRYEIVENEKGEKEYPVVWIRGFKSFEEIEYDVENPFVTDEHETEETEIDTEE